MNKKKSSMNEEWEKIFEKYNILSEIEKNDSFNITAKQINETSGREPRLMANFGNSQQVPEIFRLNNLSILPDTRGSYIIGKFNVYKEYEYENLNPTTVEFPSNIQSIDPNQISSEAVALNVAKITGMIDIVMETNLEYDTSELTLSGRMSSGKFDYSIETSNKSNLQFNVNNSQIEVDASYENNEKVAIFEAKNKMPSDFMIRQLYYPYRTFKNLKIKKKIIPVFFTFVDDIFSFTTYEFKNDSNYTSINKIKQQSFILDENLEITIDELKRINEESKVVKESKIFPQANSFPKVLDILDHLETPKNKFELGDDYEFNERQGDYYGNALVYLDYARKNKNGKFELTEKGEKIRQLRNSNRRNRMVIEDILCHELFNTSMNEYFKNNCEINDIYRDSVSETIFNTAYNVDSMSTATRRTSTVIQWIKWIVSMAE